MGPASADKALRRSDRCDALDLPSRQHETTACPAALHRSLLKAQLKEANKDEVLDVDFEVLQKDLYEQVHTNALAERVRQRFGSQLEAVNVVAHRELPRAATAIWRWPAPEPDTPMLEEITPGFQESAGAVPTWASHPLGIPSFCSDPAYHHHHHLLSNAAKDSGTDSAPPVDPVVTPTPWRSAPEPRAAAMAEGMEAEAQREAKGQQQQQQQGDIDSIGVTHHGCSVPPKSPPSPRTPRPHDSVMMKAVPVLTIDASVKPRRKVTDLSIKPFTASKAASAPQSSLPPTEMPISPPPATVAPERSPSQQRRQQSCRVSSGISASQLSNESTYDFDEQEFMKFSRPRKLATRLCAHPDFELGVVLLILANTVTLALYRPTEQDNSRWNRALFWAEVASNGLFTIEMLLRVVALGGPLAYLRHPWNVFDGAMVVVGYIAFVPTGSNSSSSGLRALRALRALRPLRTVTRFESLRAIVVCFLEAVPLLGSAVGLMLLFMLIFAVAGTILFAGVYHRKCYSNISGLPEESLEDPDMLGCGGWRHCPANYTCRVTAHSDALNIAGFSNTGLSLLSVFQVITLTGWSFAMYRTIDNTNPAAAIYYVLLVSIGAYVLVNLFLAVLKIKFAKAQTAFRARNTGRNRSRRNSVMTLLVKAKSRFSELSARRSASHTLNTSLARLVTTRMSQCTDSNRSLSGLMPDNAITGAAPTVTAITITNASTDAGAAAATTSAGQTAFRTSAHPIEPSQQYQTDLQQPLQTPPKCTRDSDNGGGGGGDGGARKDAGRRRSTNSSGGNAGSSSSSNLGLLDPRAGGEELVAALRGPTFPPQAKAASRTRRTSAPVWTELQGSLSSITSSFWRFSSIGRPILPPLSTQRVLGTVAEAPVAAVEASASAALQCTAAAKQLGDCNGDGDGDGDGNGSGSGGGNRIHGDGNGDGSRGSTAGENVGDLTGGSSPNVRFGDQALPPMPLERPGAGVSPATAAVGTESKAPRLSGELRNQQRMGSRTLRISRNIVVPLPPPTPPPPAGAELPPLAISPSMSPRAPMPQQLSPLPRSALRNTTAAAAATATATATAATAAAAGRGAGSFVSQAAAGAGTAPLQTQPSTFIGPAHTASGFPSFPSDPQQLLAGGNLAMAALMMDPAEFDEFVAGEPPLRRLKLRAMFRARVLVESSWFSYIMLAVIFANTVVLAMEYDGMSEKYQMVLTHCNYGFAALFTLEMAIKLFAMGIWDYITDGFNMFDGLIVALSWLEIILTYVGTSGNLNAMAALRAVRALRLLKAFRYLGSLRKIAAKLLASFSSFAAVAVLIALFWGVFAIVGLHVFGGLDLARDPYPNFDTFMNSLVTTFNILTLENYQNNMYETIRTTNYGSALFFVAWIVVGKYILLTLFLAVTLEAFEAKYDSQSGSSSWISKMRSAMDSAVESVLGSVRRTSRGDSHPSPLQSSLADSILSSDEVVTPTTTANGFKAPNVGQRKQQNGLAHISDAVHGVAATAAAVNASQYGRVPEGCERCADAEAREAPVAAAVRPRGKEYSQLLDCYAPDISASSANGRAEAMRAAKADLDRKFEKDRLKGRSSGDASEVAAPPSRPLAVAVEEEGDGGMADPPPFRRVHNRTQRTSSPEQRGNAAMAPSRYDSVSSLARELDIVNIVSSGGGSPGVQSTNPAGAGQSGPVAEKMGRPFPLDLSIREGVAAWGTDSGDGWDSRCKAGSSFWTAPVPVEAQALSKGVPVYGPNDIAAAVGAAATAKISSLSLPLASGVAVAAGTAAAQLPDQVFLVPTTNWGTLHTARTSATSDGGGGGGGGSRPMDMQITQNRKRAERGERKDLARSISEQSPVWSPKAMRTSCTSAFPASVAATISSASTVTRSLHKHGGGDGVRLSQLVPLPPPLPPPPPASLPPPPSPPPPPVSHPASPSPSPQSQPPYDGDEQESQRSLNNGAPVTASEITRDADPIQGGSKDQRQGSCSCSSSNCSGSGSSTRSGGDSASHVGCSISRTAQVVSGAQAGAGNSNGDGVHSPSSRSRPHRAIASLSSSLDLSRADSMTAVPAAAPEEGEEAAAAVLADGKARRGSDVGNGEDAAGAVRYLDTGDEELILEAIASSAREDLVPERQPAGTDADAGGDSGGGGSGRQQCEHHTGVLASLERKALARKSFDMLVRQSSMRDARESYELNDAAADLGLAPDLTSCGEVTSEEYGASRGPGKEEAFDNCGGVVASVSTPDTRPDVIAQPPTPLPYHCHFLEDVGRSSIGSRPDAGDGTSILTSSRQGRRRTRTHVSIDLPPEVEESRRGYGGGGGTAASNGSATMPLQRRISSGLLSCASTDSLDIPENSPGLCGPQQGPVQGPVQDGRRSIDVSYGLDFGDTRSSGRVDSTSLDAVVGSGQREPRPTAHRRRHTGRIPLEGKVLFLVGPDNPLRKRVYRLVDSRPFEYVLFCVIVANCGMMTLESPSVSPDSRLGQALYWGNAACTAIFAGELLIKVFAWTFMGYIRDMTNQVDFVVVITGLLDLGLSHASTQAMSALRVLRALKPLRLLTRSAGMRLVFKSVVLSLGAMAHVSVLCVMFLIIFAILGVQLFSGKLHSCNDRSVSGRSMCVGSFLDPDTGATLERTWDNVWPNFDNVGNALLACFVVASCNGYSDLMTATMSAPAKRGQQPRLNINAGAFFWFVGFTVVVSFTLLNLYVGVIFSQFSRIRNMSTTGSAFLTSQQQEWVEMSKMVFRLRPPDKGGLPKGRLRLPARRLTQSTGFERVMLTVIVANVVVLAATWYGNPPEVEDIQEKLNIAFTGIYTLEAVLKLYSLGSRTYFADPWNKFDFVVVVSGLVEVALSFLHTGYVRVLRVFRLQRLLRVTRLVRKSKGVRTLFQALVMSLPAFGNVGALIGLMFFMWAYVGVLLFGRVRRDDLHSAINSAANFANFGNALSVLLRVATGDNWTDIMYGCMVQPPHCSRSTGDCGSWLALPYFLLFFLLIAIIMLNLFTAVIIENFEKAHEQDEWRLTPQNLEDFVMLWSEYDDGSGTISPAALEQLLLRLDPPLGLGPYADNKEVLKFVYDLDIPLVSGRVPFHKTAFELVKRISKTDIPDGQLKTQMDGLVEAFFRDLNTSSQRDDQMRFTVAFSVMLIQRRWRSRFRANRLKMKRAWREARRDAPTYRALVDGPGPQLVAEALMRAGERVGAEVTAARESQTSVASGAGPAPEVPRAAGPAERSVRCAKARSTSSGTGIDPRVSATAAMVPTPHLSCNTVFLGAPALGGDAVSRGSAASLRWRFNPNLVPPGLTAAVADAAAAAAAAQRRQQASQREPSHRQRLLPQQSLRQQQQQTPIPLLPWSPLRGLAMLASRISGNPTGEPPPPPRGDVILAQTLRFGSGTGRTVGIMRRLLGSQTSMPRQTSLRPRAWAGTGDGSVLVGGTAAAAAPFRVDGTSLRTVSTVDGAPCNEPLDRLSMLVQPGSVTRVGDSGGGIFGLRGSMRWYLSSLRRGTPAALEESGNAAALSSGVGGSGGGSFSRRGTSWWKTRPEGIHAQGASVPPRGAPAPPPAPSPPLSPTEAGDATAAAVAQRKFRAMLDFAMAAGELATGGDESFLSRRTSHRRWAPTGGGSTRPSSAASDGGGSRLGAGRDGGGGAADSRLRLTACSGARADAGSGNGSSPSDSNSDGDGDGNGGMGWAHNRPLGMIAEEGGDGGGSGGVHGNGYGDDSRGSTAGWMQGRS